MLPNWFLSELYSFKITSIHILCELLQQALILSEILNKSLDVREVRKTVLLKIEHVFGIKLQTN